MVTNFRKKLKGSNSKQAVLHVVGVAILLIFVLLLYANYKIYQKKQEFLSQVSQLQAQVKNLQQSNDSLQQGISNQNNSQYIEQVAREQLDLQKQGETVVSFVMPATPPQKPAAGQQGTLQSFGDWIKSKF